jgi:hypothetical protein
MSEARPQWRPHWSVQFFRVAALITTFTAACAPTQARAPGTGTEPLVTPIGEITPPPTHVENRDPKSFAGEIVQSRGAEIKNDFMSRFPANEVWVTNENSEGFSIRVSGEEVDFVLRKPTDEQPHEQLFIKTAIGWSMMIKQPLNPPVVPVDIGNEKKPRKYVGWALAYSDASADIILALPDLEAEDWQNMTEGQRKSFQILFQPPADLRHRYTGYDITQDRIWVSNIPERLKFLAAPVIEISYTCPINPDVPNMSHGSLEKDISNGRLAAWVRTLPSYNAPIASTPEKLDYKPSHPSADKSIFSLTAHKTDHPGWATIFSKTIGICKINPSQFGIQGKNDAYLIIGVMQDQNGNRMPTFTITGEKGIRQLLANGELTGAKNGITTQNKLSNTSNVVFIKDGVAPGKEDDLRDLANFTDFYEAQGTDINSVNNVFQEIIDSNKFSTQTIKFFETHIFYTSSYKDLN